ncbi:hypothetical protein [Holzapfeliella sp. JNUCC 80]
MSFKKTIFGLITAVFAAVMFVNISGVGSHQASAATSVHRTINSQYDKTTGYFPLGNGKFTMTTHLSQGFELRASLYQIQPWGFDKRVAYCYTNYHSKPTDISDSFRAYAKNGDQGQSYYVKFEINPMYAEQYVKGTVDITRE